MDIVITLLVFFGIILIHELGHFLVARAFGMDIPEFSIGMGPAFFKKQKGETLYSVRVFPIGGFCAMEGEDEDSEDERAFNNQPAWQRAIVLAAGSLMNLLTAIVLMIIIAFYMGQATTTIDVVNDGSPAYEAGIMHGDEVIKIDGEELFNYSYELSRNFRFSYKNNCIHIILDKVKLEDHYIIYLINILSKISNMIN